MDSNAARGALLGRPAEFLKYYPLKCAGAKAPLQNQVNLKPIYIHKQDGVYITDPKTHKAKIGIMSHTGATRPRMLGPDRKISSVKLNTMQPAGDYAQFNAHIVPSDAAVCSGWIRRWAHGDRRTVWLLLLLGGAGGNPLVHPCAAERNQPGDG